jgi:hypothetical protein
MYRERAVRMHSLGRLGLCCSALILACGILHQPAEASVRQPRRSASPRLRASGSQRKKTPCSERKLRAAPRNAKNLIQLQANRSRPTFTIALADGDRANAALSLVPKNRARVQRDNVSAQVIEVPRKGSERIHAEVRAAATPGAGGSVVFLRVCVSHAGIFKAGSYEGTVRVYGPRITELDYALVITQKWPWWSAAGLLVLAGAAFFIATWLTNSLAFGLNDRKLVASIFGGAVTAAAIVPTFFGAYWTNDTWGADPGSNVTGLVTAGFTAAVGGLALAERLLRPSA